MKGTGIVRRVDGLGRLVLPVELRREMKIKEGTPMEMYTNGDEIVIKKYTVGCKYCGEVRNVIEFGGDKFCKVCAGDIAKLVGGE